MTEEMDKAVSLGTAVEMFKTYQDLDTLKQAGLVWDAEKGRYTNDSIVDWMNKFADKQVYGVQIPKYSYSQTTEATKTDANAGMVLEPSTNTKRGRNDYKDKKLFMCTRVNGGVDIDGMPYVTAIEGIDEEFNCETENTWAITPIYYVKRTETDEYYWNQYTDSPKDGFHICAGAYTYDHVQRPYILRACYMDSGEEFSSKSGKVPGTQTPVGVEGRNPTANDFWGSVAKDVARGEIDGLTHLAASEVSWQIEFMQLMLGVKAPKTAAYGCIIPEGDITTLRTTVSQAGSGSYVIIPKAFADELVVGCCLSIGNASSAQWPHQAAFYSIAAFAQVEAIEDVDESNAKVSLSCGSINTRVGHSVAIVWWRNGSCDNVLGTFGTPYEAGLTDGKTPFRFQNCEMLLGVYEMVCNMRVYGNAPVIATNIPVGLGDVTYETISDRGGFYFAGYNYAKYIADYKFSDNFAALANNTEASSTTGYCVTNNTVSSGTWNLLYATGCYLYSSDNLTSKGVGSNYLSIMGNLGDVPCIGSRISAVGRSEVIWYDD